MSTTSGGVGGTPARSRWEVPWPCLDGGYPGQVWMGGSPIQHLTGGYPHPALDGGYPAQVQIGGTPARSGWGYPGLPPARDGVPPPPQQGVSPPVQDNRWST